MPRKWKHRAPQIKAAKRDVPRGFFISAVTAATINAAESSEDGKPKLSTFAGRAYTGAPMKPEGWGLPLVVDLDGVKVPSQHRPVLRQHNHEQIVGHTTEVKVTTGKDGGIDIAGPFSGESQHVDKVRVPASNGFQWQLSIGATPVRTEFVEAGQTVSVNGRDFAGPGTISRETELGEISFVPLGADGDTSATVQASNRKGRVMNFQSALKQICAGKYSDEEIDKMSDDEAKANLKKCMNAADDEPDEDDKKKKDDEKAKAKAADEEEKKTEAASLARIKANRKAEANDLRRADSIRASVSKYGISQIEVDGKKVNLAAHAIEEGWSEEKTELHALRAARPGQEVGQSPHFYSTSNPSMTDAVVECALFDAMGSFRLFDSDFYRVSDIQGADGRAIRRTSEREENRITSQLKARYTDQVRQTAHTAFRGRLGLQQALTMIASSAGYRGGEVIRDPETWGNVANYLARANQPIQADSSTINIANVLANVQNKFILQGYLFSEQSFMEIVNVKPVKDFKPTKSVALFGDFVFKDLNPAGEIQHATMGDQGFANQAGLVARMLTIPLTQIVNDDLGILGQAPMMMGRGWGVKLNELVWAEFMDTANVDDGGSTAFWAATHTITGQLGNSNLSSGGGSALGSAGLQAAKLLFDRQIDPVGKPLGLDAEIIVYPPELDVTAMELMNAQYILMAGLASTSSASKQPNTNIWARRFKPVMSRYLSNSSFTGFSTTAWYMLANPAIMPVVELAAWNGNLVPTVQTASQDWQFNTLGISMRGYGGVGANIQNFRGGVKSAGT